MLLLDVVRLHPILNLRRNDDVEDGVAGSSGLERVEVLLLSLLNFCALGPVNLVPFLSLFASVDTMFEVVFDLASVISLLPPCGSEEDTNGDTVALADLLGWTGIGTA